MAKAKANKKEAAQGANDPLGPGRDALLDGDYPSARSLLNAAAEDPSLSEADRAEARRLSKATGWDALTLKVGLACFGLFSLVILVTILKQP